MAKMRIPAAPQQAQKMLNCRSAERKVSAERTIVASWTKAGRVTGPRWSATRFGTVLPMTEAPLKMASE